MAPKAREYKRTLYPGIYKVLRAGKPSGFMVAFRIPGKRADHEDLQDLEGSS
jgi:hypothetical protein